MVLRELPEGAPQKGRQLAGGRGRESFAEHAIARGDGECSVGFIFELSFSRRCTAMMTMMLKIRICW